MAIEHHTHVVTGVAIVVAIAVAGVSGYTQGQWASAITFALAVSAVGALLIAMYGLFVRLIENHLKHMLEETLEHALKNTLEPIAIDAVMILRHPGVGDATMKDNTLKLKEVQADFEAIRKISRSKKE